MALSDAERQRRRRERKRAEQGLKPAIKRDVTGEKKVTSRHGWSGDDDLIAFLESLPRVQVGRDGYTERDRAADFIATFNSERGKRVIAQIALICDPPSLLSDADKSGTLAFKSGMRRVMNEIQRCFVIRAPVTLEAPADDLQREENIHRV